MRRLLSTATIAVALSIPAVATLGFAGVAGAKSGPIPTPGSSVACTSVKYVSSTDTANVTKCYTAPAGAPTTKAFKTLGASPASTLLFGGTLNWSSGPGSVTTSALASATPTGTCSKKDTNSAYSGTVSSVTGTGNPVQAGDLIYVDVCLQALKNGGLKVSLAKGSVAEF